VRLDHVTTYAEVDALGDVLAAYRRAGFPVSDRVVAHANGVRSGTIWFGSEYLELLVVEDVDAFVKLAPMNDRLVCSGWRPFGIGFKSPDVGALHEAWTARGIELPELSRLHAADGAGALEWRILQVPLKTLRGASCFVIEKGDTAAPPPLAAPNATYALAGITMVSAEAEERVRQWRALLAPDHPLQVSGVDAVPLGHHRVCWMTPDEFHVRSGHAWQAAGHPLGEIGIVHLLSEDLDRTRACLTRAGRAWTDLVPAREAILVDPDPTDGLRLAIHACPRAQWDAARRVSHGPEIQFWA
jgi:hypothetical protein